MDRKEFMSQFDVVYLSLEDALKDNPNSYLSKVDNGFCIKCGKYEDLREDLCFKCGCPE